MPGAMTRTLTALLVALSLPSVASAHAILIDSTPAIRASIPAGPEAMTLKFNSRIDRERSRLTLIGPDKAETRLPVGADGPPDVMTTSTTLTPGAYTVRWQVLAVDGHITRGDVPFSVVAP
jgi:methionine-rich copper-binding protein CopC